TVVERDCVAVGLKTLARCEISRVAGDAGETDLIHLTGKISFDSFWLSSRAEPGRPWPLILRPIAGALDRLSGAIHVDSRGGRFADECQVCGPRGVPLHGDKSIRHIRRSVKRRESHVVRVG